MTQHLGDPTLHFWLTRSVAKAMGLNLSEAMANSRLTTAEYAAMVTACRQCPRVDSCQCWLGDQRTLAQDTPPGCANADLLRELARLH